jgi:hypothetical protein
MLAFSLVTFSDLLPIMPPLAAHALRNKAMMKMRNNRKELILMLQRG